MSSPSEKAPWPSPTQAPDLNPSNSQPPFHRRSLKRRKPYDVTPDTTDITARQVADWPETQRAGRQCQINAGNEILSCFPTANTVIPQDQWAAFVWNSRHPEFTQTNRVNIYLFHGDSRRQILAERNVINPTGRSGEFTAQVDDRWWGDRGSAWNGANLTYPFYWVITRSDKGLDGTEIPQTMFNAVQTTYASSVAASMSSTAAQSSSTGNSASRTDSGITSATGATGNVQPDGDSAGFPHWAIAVIVVLGFLAIASSCILAFFILRRVRRRKEAANSNRNSMGSSSPMMANAGRPETPLLAPGLDRQSSIGHRNVPSVVSPDGASTISRSASVGDGPFSGADAAIMADAFRQALRKPDFGGRPVEEGESPDAIEKAAKAELLNKELAEEGRDIRSVSSSRGVRVESIASHDTVQDHRH